MPEEKEIIQKLKSGDVMSLEHLYQNYGKALYAYALSLTHTREISEDIVTDTFIQIYEYIQKGKDVKSLKALIYTICRNLSYDSIKRRGRVDAMPEELQDTSFPFDKKLEVKLAVDELPSPEKEIVILYCVHELKHKEIAQILQLAEGTVRWKYRRAISHLKKSLSA